MELRLDPEIPVTRLSTDIMFSIKAITTDRGKTYEDTMARESC